MVVDIFNDTIVVGAPSGDGGAAGTVSKAGRAFVICKKRKVISIFLPF